MLTQTSWKLDPGLSGHHPPRTQSPRQASESCAVALVDTAKEPPIHGLGTWLMVPPRFPS